jgi:hypothetical protein
VAVKRGGAGLSPPRHRNRGDGCSWMYRSLFPSFHWLFPFYRSPWGRQPVLARKAAAPCPRGARGLGRTKYRSRSSLINQTKLSLAMGATCPGGSLPRVAVLLLLALSVQAQRTWFKQLPPNNYYEPDVDVTSPTALPRIPISPYHRQVRWGFQRAT